MTGKHDILLIDDDKFLLDMYTMKFVQQGFGVQACLSVKDAIELLRRGDYAPDAILFDIAMPEEDGFAFLEALGAQHLCPGAKKVALTNQSSEDDRQHALSLGADLYLVKASMIPSEVVQAVTAALG